jgi:hypothetical protein
MKRSAPRGGLMGTYRTPSALAIVVLGLLVSPSAEAAGGACPTGAGYVSPTDPTGPRVTLSSLGITSCYFISAKGSDSAAGTSEHVPWLHAPGMPGCSSACAGVTPAAGEGFIFEGGGSWHHSSGSPASGKWAWTESGSSWSSPIYIGVDPTWYSGSSFARPVINMDNPLSTGTVSSCVYDDDSTQAIDLSGTSNVYLDNFEFTGACSTGSGYGGYIYSGAKVIVENVYIHGWTLTAWPWRVAG